MSCMGNSRKIIEMRPLADIFPENLQVCVFLLIFYRCIIKDISPLLSVLSADLTVDF